MNSKKLLKYLLFLFIGIIVVISISLSSIILYQKYNSYLTSQNNHPIESKTDTISYTKELKGGLFGDKDELSASLKWKDEYMYYRIFFKGDNYKKIKKTPNYDDYQITINFKDKDAFSMASIKINKKDLVNYELGIYSSFQHEGKIKLDKSSFLSIIRLDSHSNFLYN
jgi:hypothetical protein